MVTYFLIEPTHLTEGYRQDFTMGVGSIKKMFYIRLYGVIARTAEEGKTCHFPLCWFVNSKSVFAIIIITNLLVIKRVQDNLLDLFLFLHQGELIRKPLPQPDNDDPVYDWKQFGTLKKYKFTKTKLRKILEIAADVTWGLSCKRRYSMRAVRYWGANSS